MRLKLLPAMLLLAVFSAGVLAAPQLRYRLVPIPDIEVRAMNNRGEVIGNRSARDAQIPVLWIDGTTTELGSAIDPAARYIEATGLNDRTQIIGFFVTPGTSMARGFLLDRDEVTYIDGPPTANGVFLTAAINDREQIYVSTTYADGNEKSFIYEDGRLRPVDTCFTPIDINLRGTVAGTQFTDAMRAATWQDGVITPIAGAPSRASGINDRGQVIGLLVRTGGTRAFVWERGQRTVLPALLADQTRSRAEDINNAGRIVGITTRNKFDSIEQFATVWDNGEVADLNTLIHPNDPLRTFVSLTWATLINDRGEIVARGRDSRTIGESYYFLKPVRGP